MTTQLDLEVSASNDSVGFPGVEETQVDCRGGGREALFGVGDRVADRFRILRPVGRGGMGAVYEAEDLELRERVALKAIYGSHLGRPETAERFRREIALARKVTHPSMCRVYDLFYHRVEDEEILLLSMELLSGPTLEKYLADQGPLPEATVAGILDPLLDGLSAAHRAGVIHRDLKCANVMLVPVPGRDLPRPVITDFGLALPHEIATYEIGDPEESKAGSRWSRITAEGSYLGSPAYMAPEQVLDGEITPATDIYALGILLFEMLTGRLPFGGKSVLATLYARIT